MSGKKKTVTRLDSHYMQQYEVHMERKRRKKQRLIRRLVLFAIVIMLSVGAMTTYHLSQRDLRKEKTMEYEKLTQQLKDLEIEEKNLKEEIQLLNDDEYILDLARTDYFFSKKGEIIFKSNEEDSSY